jgi:transitional endoplasmic reticulum ATPase
MGSVVSSAKEMISSCNTKIAPRLYKVEIVPYNLVEINFLGTKLPTKQEIGELIQKYSKGFQKMATSKTEEKEPPRKIDVEFHGDKFIIPHDMDYDEAIEALARQRDEENTDVSIQEMVNAFPLDGAVAFQKALKEKYGWANLVPTPGFFGSSPPTMVGVEIAFGQTLQIPWGRCIVPKVDGTLSTGWRMENDMPVFNLTATVKRRHEKNVAEIAKRVREIVATESIYRGQAVKLNFRDTDGERRYEFSPTFAPKFIDLKKYAGQEIVYSSETQRMIETNLFNPVQHTERCRKNGIPLKRGILLEGRYGTGKTLTAHRLAQICVQNGWTFLYVEDVRDLDLALAFAKLYSPCVLFAEDVDRTMPNGPRTPEIDKILNTLDGVESKHIEVMTVLTTNHVGGIHSGFLRPGRIDTVIPIQAPDDNAMLRLVRHYGKTKAGESIVEGTDADIITAVKGLKGSNAAFVQEAVERAKLSAIGKNEDKMVITPDDISVAVASMQTHIRMVCPEAGMQIEEGDEVIDPMKMAFDIMMDQCAFHLLNKIANPKTLEKIILKQSKRRRGMGPFSNN